MKKFLMTIVAILATLTMSAKDEPMTLATGSLQDLADPANTVDFVINYDNATVHHDDGKYTVADYLKSKGSDYVADWDSDKEKARTYLVVRYNQKNKKGAKANEIPGNANIIGTVNISDIEFGHAGGMFIPFGGAKAGGAVVSGTLVFTKDGKEMATLPFKEIKGIGHVSETVRLAMAYYEVAQKLNDVMKKEAKKKK
jgi:hypothetical protein